MTDEERARKLLNDLDAIVPKSVKLILLAAEFAAIREEAVKKAEEWARQSRLDGKKTVTAEQMADHLEALASVLRGMGISHDT